MTLLDSGAGGTGQQIGAAKVVKELENDEQLRILLAGGLNPDNVAEAVTRLGLVKGRVVGVDVSSGVETNGKQDLNKIEKFVAAAKAIDLSK
jgi:anthranilate synthase/indole-3-glycerol phosphate synthase/phosphoribosylanthranilate isomerase